MIVEVIRQMIGMVLASLILPMLIFVPLTYLPATKGRHKLKYMVTGAIAVTTPWVMVNGGAPPARALVASFILGSLFYWSYLRAVGADRQSKAGPA